MPVNYEEQTISILVDAVNDLEGRGEKYKEALLPLVAETIAAQRKFEQGIAGNIVPKLKDAIDAHCQVCPEPTD